MNILTACTRDCPDACGIVATVEDGRVTRLAGDPNHPFTKGFLCQRTNRFLERQYDPDRLTEPLVRRGDGFEPISWDAALDLIAGKLLAVREESGPAAILAYRSGGSLGLVKHVTDLFWERFGPVTVKSGDICSGAGDAAQILDFGVEDSHDVFDLLNSRAIVLWGKNPYVSNVHLIPVLHEARARGAVIVQIDPVHHRGSDLANFALQPRPGGDVALALGVLRTLAERGGLDAGAKRYCDNLDLLLADAMARPLDAWAALADVAPGDIVRVADLLAARPAAILVGWGMQRRGNGSLAVRMLDALAAASGNLGIAGGGVSFYFKRRGAFDTSFARGLEVAPRAIPEAALGQGIVDAADPPVRVVFVTNANPVTMLPDSRTVAHALRSRELTVVVDSFLTDTAREAHLVLPTTTMLEDDDLVGAYGSHFIANVRPVVAPPPGARTDLAIVQELARRVGLGGDLLETASAWKRRILAPAMERGVTLEALEAGAVRSPLSPRILFENREFDTSTGRVNLVHGVDPEPPRPTPERPLLLMALSTEKAQGSQWPRRTQQGPTTVTVHPDAASGLADGAEATLESEVGAMRVRVAHDPRQRRDVALMAKGGWLSAGRCANALIPPRLTDDGGGAAYYDTPVRLVPIRPIREDG